MSYTLQQHLAYNVWANRKIAEFLESAGENIFHSEVISSFPSLQKQCCTFGMPNTSGSNAFRVKALPIFRAKVLPVAWRSACWAGCNARNSLPIT